MTSTATISNSGLFVDPREDWLAQYQRTSSIPRGRSSIRIIISGIAATSLSDRGDGRRHRHRPQHHRHRLCRMPFDVSRARARGIPAGRRSRIRQRRRRDERERRLRQGRDLRRHRRPRRTCCSATAASRVLEAEIAAGDGRFRGIRHSSAWDAATDVARHVCQPAEGADARSDLPQGLCLPGAAEPELRCLAVSPADRRAGRSGARLSRTRQIVLDHAAARSASVATRATRRNLSRSGRPRSRRSRKCQNVVVKLGGLAMCLFGYDFHLRAKPPSSEELAAAWRPYIETCIEAFGPRARMFESNFPPDKGQCSYQVIFNAFKRIAAHSERGREDGAVLADGDRCLPARTAVMTRKRGRDVGPAPSSVVAAGKRPLATGLAGPQS